MAPSQLFLVSLLVLLLAMATHLVEPRPVLESKELVSGVGEGSLDKAATMDCGGACNVRCSESSRPNLCKRACGTCCARCNCVPPGTYGNYQTCPCYAAMTTKDGEPKCP